MLNIQLWVFSFPEYSQNVLFFPYFLKGTVVFGWKVECEKISSILSQVYSGCLIAYWSYLPFLCTVWFLWKIHFGKLLTCDGTNTTCSLKQSQCLKTFLFILLRICQERAKRGVILSVPYRIEDSRITHHLRYLVTCKKIA